MSKSSDIKIKYLTQQETQKLFDAIEYSDSIHSIRDLAIFKLHIDVD